MNIVLTLLFVAIVPLLAINKQYKILLVLCLVSLINNLFFISFFGTRIPLHNYIALVSFPFLIPFYGKLLFKKRVNFMHLLSLDFLSLVLLAIIFGVLFPWEVIGVRAWNQLPLGRSVVALFRLFLDIALAGFIYFAIIRNKISLKEILSIAFIIASAQILLGFFDFFTNYPLRSALFTERQIPGRFLGFSHEPRSMARNVSFVLLLLFSAFIANREKYKVNLFQILFLLFGILFTISASSIIALGLSGFVFFLIKNKKNRFSYLLSFLLVGGIAFQIIKTTKFYEAHILPRIIMVAVGGLEYGIIKDEPLFLTRLEVMDRAAANFFYHYPKHLLLGTGPNLVGLPSTPYLTRSAKITYEGKVVAVPGTGLIYVLGRNGIMGLFLLFILYNHLRKRTKRDLFRNNLLFFTFFYFLFIHPSWFYFNIGLIAAIDTDIN